MSDGPTVGAGAGPAPSTMGRVLRDLLAAEKSKIGVVEDAEGLVSSFCGPGLLPSPPAPAAAPDSPAGTVNAVDAVVQRLIALDARHEAAFACLRAAIG